jgi:hypothetical protein
MSFTDKVRSLFARAAARIKRIASLTIQNVKSTLKNLWRNAEGVAILTIGSLGASHFIGSYVFEHQALNSLIFAEMIGPVAAIGLMWILLRSMTWRRNRRFARS